MAVLSLCSQVISVVLVLLRNGWKSEAGANLKPVVQINAAHRGESRRRSDIPVLLQVDCGGGVRAVPSFFRRCPYVMAHCGSRVRICMLTALIRLSCSPSAR